MTSLMTICIFPGYTPFLASGGDGSSIDQQESVSCRWVVVQRIEHLATDQEDPGSNPGGPSLPFSVLTRRGILVLVGGQVFSRSREDFLRTRFRAGPQPF
jgi:hypothetical protein